MPKIRRSTVDNRKYKTLTNPEIYKTLCPHCHTYSIYSYSAQEVCNKCTRKHIRLFHYESQVVEEDNIVVGE